MVKAVTAAARSLITDSTSVYATPRLLAEWEHNRFSAIKVNGLGDLVTVSPAQGTDAEWLAVYDLDAITLPNRPGKGAVKARLDYKGEMPLGTSYTDKVLGPRYYVPTDQDIYKYWSSPQKTGTTLAGGGYAFSAPIVLTLEYQNPVPANKLVVGFETTYASPKSYKIEVSTNGTTWTDVGSYPALDSNGRITLWRNAASGAWSGTPDYADPYAETTSLKAARLKAIRLTVTSMDKQNSHLDVIQMGLRLESDLSQFVESYNRSFEIADRSFVAPLGRASSNMAEVTLDNIDGFFNGENTNSLFYGMINKKVKFTMDLLLDATSTGGAASEPVREFTMWTDSWGGEDQVSSTASLKDSSVLLQETKVPPVFWNDVSIGASVWQMLDILGFTNYSYSRHDLDSGQKIKYFWPDDDATAWDQIGNIAEGTQTAIYFDEYDILQIKTRRAMFDPAETIDWNLDATQNGTKQPDIVDVTAESESVVNQVDINYRPAHFSPDVPQGFPKMEIVWEPEQDTMTLRAANLTKDLLDTDTSLYISPTDATIWSYSALINIRGEVLRYDAKEYIYNKVGGGTATVWVDSQEKKDDTDAPTVTNPALKYANKFTGRLRIVERGLYGSGKATHKLRQTGYSGMITNVRGYGAPWMGGFMQQQGYLTLNPFPGAWADKFFLVRHETSINPLVTSSSKYWTFGTKIRFPRTGTQCAGIWFDGDAADSGYYLQLQTTAHCDNYEKRAWRHEISLTTKISTTATHEIQIPINGDFRGVRADIQGGRWYTLDAVLEQSVNGVSEWVTVYLDGRMVAVFTVPSGSRPTVNDNRFGVFTRWNTLVDFEYLYGVGDAPDSDEDASSFWDLRDGGFTSGYIQREWKYRSLVYSPLYKGKRYVQSTSRSNYAFDEFGPVVHEMRLIDAQFDDSYVPVQHSNLYSSNPRIAIVDYVGGPFGAQLLLANASRVNEIVAGEDTLTFGPDNSIDHKLFVFGRALYQEDDVKLTKEDPDSIRRNGVSSLTFENRFIQDETAANELGDWIVSLWKNGSDELRVEIFGNPLLQLGDLVTINDPVKMMTPTTHKYFVVSIQNNFNNGLNTELMLRRARL